MRCKNCGSQNDDNLYICQNCGSPLYDEEENTEPDEPTKAVPKVKSERPNQAKQGEQGKGNDKKQNTTLTAIIIVLVIVLIALIAGIVALATSGRKNNEETSVNNITTSSPDESNSYTTEPKTEFTTESTTEKTTTTTTTEAQPKTYRVALSCNQGGEVEGDGEYTEGERVIIIARANDGYEFDGWYEGSKKITDSTTYRFNIKSDMKLKAKFLKVEEGSTEENLDNGNEEQVDDFYEE
ncbi:MAG: hypothetical protein ACI4IL_06310 [Eubacterium sp.]